MRYAKLLVLVLLLTGVTFVAPQQVAAKVTYVRVPAGAKAKVVCANCDFAKVIVHRQAKPPIIKVDLGLFAGVIGIGTKHAEAGFAGVLDLNVEYRLSSWAGIVGMLDLGGSNGVLEDKVNSLWGTSLGLALWPLPHMRFVLGGGYLGVRNASWNASFGGPVLVMKLDVLVGHRGFAVGLVGCGGPAWTYWGDLASSWMVTAGVRWFFGGERK